MIAFSLVASVGQHVLQAVLPSLLALIGSMIVAVLIRLFTRLGFEVSAANADRLKVIVEDAIHAAEEAARRNPSMTSTQKAVYAENLVTAQRLEMSSAEAKRAIDAVLPKVRAQLTPSTPGSFGR